MNRRDLLIVGLLFVLWGMVLPEYLGAQKSDAILTQGLRREFSSGSQGVWFVFVFLILLFALVGGLIYFDIFIRRRHKAGFDNPRYLFTELVRAHGLTRVERQFLMDFAGKLDLEDSLPLFIEPKYFLAALDDDRFRASHGMIEYLLKKLFDIDPGNFVPSKKPPESTGTTTIIYPSVDD